MSALIKKSVHLGRNPIGHKNIKYQNKFITEKGISKDWIPAVEKIPKLGQKILVSYEDGEIWLDFLAIDGEFFGESKVHGKVVAWMPLPKTIPSERGRKE